MIRTATVPHRAPDGQADRKGLRRRIVVEGQPVAKPRMTRRDRWKSRPCVTAYRAWADQARLQATGSPFRKLAGRDVRKVTVRAFFTMPPSWPKRKQEEYSGGEHRAVPDPDNVLKAVLDALIDDDRYVTAVSCETFWTLAGEPPFTVITIER